MLYDFRDLKKSNPSYAELKSWLALSGLPVKKLFNTSGAQFKAQNLKDKLTMMSDDECLKLLASDGMLVKRPLLITDSSVLVGFKEAEWEQLI